MTSRAFRVVPMDARDSAEWGYGRDAVRHASGRYFSITGLEFRAPEAPAVERRLVIDQPERGILGFVVRRGRTGVEVLVQEKYEPGNVRGVQLAPTCQATASNLDRVHGGAPPPGAEFFTGGPPAGILLADSIQSEQGSRFFRKTNRNAAVEAADAGPAAAPLVWRRAPAFLRLLADDYRVNTDARSVLVSSPWGAWTVREPFARAPRVFREAWASVSEARTSEAVAGHLAWLEGERRRLAAEAPRLVPLGAVPGVRRFAGGLSGGGGAAFDVRHFAVRIPSRERVAWDQPLVASRGTGRSDLLAFRRDRELFLLFRAAWEPGLHDAVELQPTILVEPGTEPRVAASPFARAARSGRVLARAWQSEEGGRFFRERVLHRVVLIDDPGDRLPEEVRGVRLREAEGLARAGALTNEARSTLSLVLAFL